MKRIFCLVGCLVFGSVNAATLTFDDVTAQNDFFGNTYHEWTLNEAGIYENLWAPASVSGENYITNYNSRIGSFRRGISFDFNGAYFTSDGRYFGAEGLEVLVSGLNSLGVSTITQTIILSTTPQFYTFDWDNIYGISWDAVNPNSNNIGIDNFTFTEANSVPEPSTIAILALGLAGIGFSRKKPVGRTHLS